MRRGGEVIAVGRRQWRSTESHRPDQWKAHGDMWGNLLLSGQRANSTGGGTLCKDVLWTNGAVVSSAWP
jgi:hypothetical protein